MNELVYESIIYIYSNSSLSCARVVRLAFLFLRPLVPNLIRVQNIIHCVGCHSTKGHDVNLTLRVYFAPTNFTLSEYLASKHFGDSAVLYGCILCTLS